MITQERLKELLHYDSGTGVFTWKAKSSRGTRVGSVAGCEYQSSYRRIRADNKLYLAHRLAWLYVHGNSPVEIDHIDRDKSNNAIDNLREVTKSQNQHNRKSNGYYLYTRTGKYVARIKLMDKTICLGSFRTADEARAAYIKGKEIYHEGRGL